MKAFKKLFGRKKKQSNTSRKNRAGKHGKKDTPAVITDSQKTQRTASAVSTTAELLRAGEETDREGFPTSKDFTLTTDSVYSASEVEPSNSAAPASIPEDISKLPSTPSAVMSEAKLTPPPPEQDPASEEMGPGALVSTPKKKKERDTATADEDAPHVIKSYDAVPVLEQTKLPRGGVSVETQAVGRVQVCAK